MRALACAAARLPRAGIPAHRALSTARTDAAERRPFSTARAPAALNAVSATITAPKARGAAQAMLLATGLTREDLGKPQVRRIPRARAVCIRLILPHLGQHNVPCSMHTQPK